MFIITPVVVIEIPLPALNAALALVFVKYWAFAVSITLEVYNLPQILAVILSATITFDVVDAVIMLPVNIESLTLIFLIITWSYHYVIFSINFNWLYGYAWE